MDHEERFGMLEDGMHRLMIHLGLDNQVDRPPNPNPRPYEDGTIKIDIPDFDGLTHEPEHYLDWESRMDQYFEFKRTPPDHQFKVAKVKMTKVASTWLEGIQRLRLREGRGRIQTSDKLKKHMKRKYVPPTYRQQLYVQYGTLKQGSRPVQEYI